MCKCYKFVPREFVCINKTLLSTLDRDLTEDFDEITFKFVFIGECVCVCARARAHSHATEVMWSSEHHLQMSVLCFHLAFQAPALGHQVGKANAFTC